MPANLADPVARSDAAHAPIDDIQVLRAVAILCVLVEHSWFNLLFHQEWLTYLLRHVPLWCGVDFFFVISGFVITRSLLPQVLAGGTRGRFLARFWIRRAFRLWPAAWLWLALMMAGGLIFVHPPFMGTFALNARGALAGVFAFANFRFASMPGQPYGASYAYWSLSLEEQFYLLLPPLMLLARQQIGWVALAAIVIQFPLPHPRLYFFLRNDGLLWGVLLASSPWLAHMARRGAVALQHIPVAAPLILITAIAEMARLSPFFEQSPPFLIGAMAAVAAIPVALASANLNLFGFGRLRPALLWIGSRSYALYLCHVPLYQCAAAAARRLAEAMPVLAPHTDLCATLIALPVLLGAAEATHLLVETRFREVGVRLAGQWREASPSAITKAV